MLPFLYLVHAGLGGLLLAAAWLPAGARVVAVRTVAILGALAGFALPLASGPGAAWRTTVLERDGAAIAAATVVAAWVLVGLCDQGRGRWQVGTFVGVAASALTLGVAGIWTVPWLLFWVVSSIALAGLALDHPARASMWGALFASDVLVVAALASVARDTGSWRMPEELSGWMLYAVLAAAGLRAGIVPRMGFWRSIGTYSGPAVPLFAGGAFALLVGPASADAPWAAVAFVGVALAIGMWGSLRRTPTMAAPAAWATALGAGVAAAVPAAAAGAGVIALLSVTAATLWPMARGRGRATRGLLFAATPLTGAFGAVAFAAVESFERAVEITDLGRSIPWMGLSILLPVAVAASVVLGTRVARDGSSAEFEPAAVLASWTLLAVAVAIAIASGGVVAASPVLGPEGQVLRLYALAAVVGAAAGMVAIRRGPPPSIAPVEPGGFVVPPSPRPSPAVAVAAAGVLGVAAVAGTTALTVAGLRVGFL